VFGCLLLLSSVPPKGYGHQQEGMQFGRLLLSKQLPRGQFTINQPSLFVAEWWVFPKGLMILSRCIFPFSVTLRQLRVLSR